MQWCSWPVQYPSTQAVHVASSCKFANSWLCSSTSNERQQRSLMNGPEVPLPDLNSANQTVYRQFAAKPPNFKTTNNFGYTVRINQKEQHQKSVHLPTSDPYSTYPLTLIWISSAVLSGWSDITSIMMILSSCGNYVINSLSLHITTCSCNYWHAYENDAPQKLSLLSWFVDDLGMVNISWCYCSTQERIRTGG